MHIYIYMLSICTVYVLRRMALPNLEVVCIYSVRCAIYNKFTVAFMFYAATILQCHNPAHTKLITTSNMLALLTAKGK